MMKWIVLKKVSLFSLFLGGVTAIQASSLIPEFERLQGKTEDEIFTALDSDLERTRECFFYFQTKELNRLRTENYLLREQCKGVPLDSFKLDQDVQKQTLENTRLKNTIESLEKNQIETSNRFFEKQYNQLSLFSEIKASFWGDLNVFSKINEKGDRVRNKTIWMELFQSDNDLFLNYMAKKERCSLLEKCLQEKIRLIESWTAGISNFSGMMISSGLGVKKVIDSGDANFKTLSENFFSQMSAQEEEIKQLYDDLWLDPIILKRLDKRDLRGVDAKGLKRIVQWDASFLRESFYFQPINRFMHNSSFLLENIINPLSRSRNATTLGKIPFTRERVKGIFKTIENNFISLSTLSVDNQIQAKYLLLTLQFVARAANDLWKKYEPNFWLTIPLDGGEYSQSENYRILTLDIADTFSQYIEEKKASFQACSLNCFDFAFCCPNFLNKKTDTREFSASRKKGIINGLNQRLEEGYEKLLEICNDDGFPVISGFESMYAFKKLLDQIAYREVF